MNLWFVRSLPNRAQNSCPKMEHKMVLDLIKGLILFAFGSVSITLLTVAIRLWMGNREEYSHNRSRSQSLLKVIRGEVPTEFDGVRDSRVAAGIAVDTSNGSWKEQGKLSAEAVSDALR